jgi:protein-glutamine gamma-glutamyltransferase
MAESPRIAALGALAGSLIAWNWIRLEEPQHVGQAVVMILLAFAPAFGSGLRSRLVLAAFAFALAAGDAFALGLGPHAPGRLISRFAGGFGEFYDVPLPFFPGTHPHMHGAILLGVFVFTAAVVLAVVSVRPGWAVIALIVGAGWPATLLAGHELLRGSAILIGALALLAGVREKPRALGPVVAAGAVVVFAGVFASDSSALARHAFLNWQTWHLPTPSTKPVDVSYVWSSDYSGLTFPRKKTIVLRIQAPRRPQYWRVTELSDVIQGKWRDESVLDSAPGIGEPGLVPRAAEDESNWIEQRVKVEGLRDTRLPAAEVPVQFNTSQLGAVDYDRAGVAYLARQLRQGDSYTAYSYEPQPTPQQLAASKPIYPPLITQEKQYLEVEWGVWAPPFGTAERDGAVHKLFASHFQLRPYLPLYRMARRVAGGARSPYAAAVALESWFRTGGGFSYSQHPPQTKGRPELVDFVTRTRSGYCQHFAGAMALMLRYLGVPTRIAAGFSSGHYDNGEWVVTDHDAHEWVEVWFRGWGWIPFDPTPSRGGVAGAYSASSSTFDSAAAAFILAGKDGLKAFARRRGELGFPLRETAAFSADIRSSVSPPLHNVSSGHRSQAPGLLRLLALALFALAVAIAAAKLAIRRSRYLTRDPRRLARASRRELRDILLDQRVGVPSSATMVELTELARAELGLETSGLGLHATVARFAPPTYAHEAARELQRSLKALRRSLRQELSRTDRARGLLSLRSLGLS